MPETLGLHEAIHSDSVIFYKLKPRLAVTRRCFVFWPLLFCFNERSKAQLFLIAFSMSRWKTTKNLISQLKSRVSHVTSR